LGLAGIIIIAPFLIIERFSNPDVTTVRYMLDNWELYIVGFTCIGLMAIGNS